MRRIECIPQRIQRGPVREGRCIGQLIKLFIHALGGERLIAEIPRFFAVFELVDGKAVPNMIEESLFTLLLVVHAVSDSILKLGGLLPFLAENGEQGAVLIAFHLLAVKSHDRTLTGDGVHRQIAVNHFCGQFLGDGQKALIVEAMLRQISRVIVFVRHGVFVQLGVSVPQPLILLAEMVGQLRAVVAGCGFRKFLRQLAGHRRHIVHQGLVQLTDRFRGLRDGEAGVVELPAVLRPLAGGIIKGVVIAGVAALDVEVLRLVYPVKLLVRLGLPRFTTAYGIAGEDGRAYLLIGQVDPALLANLRKIAVNVGNQAVGGPVDGLQTGPQLFQLHAVRPGGDIPKAVFAGLNAIVAAHGKGNALGLHFLGVAVLLHLFGVRLLEKVL